MRNRKRRNLIASIILHTLLLVIVYAFQGAIFPYIRIAGFVPLLLPVVVTGIALYEGRDTGGICGLFAGILCDISFNQPVGVFTVVLTLVGLGIGMLSDTILLSGFISYLLCCAVVLVLCAFVQMTPLIALPNDIPINLLITTTATQTLYSMVLSLLIWFPVRALGNRAHLSTFTPDR